MSNNLGHEHYIHALDPVALHIGPLAIHWYGIAYMAGFLFTRAISLYLVRQGKSRTLTAEHIDGFLLWAMLGVIIGGRLGQVLFYYPQYYAEHPLEIFKIWQGGMSFHGGLIGVLIGFYGFTKLHRLSFFALSDVVAVSVPMAMALGRVANFINGELPGRITDEWYGIIFPHFDHEPRFPSQLLEALLEGVIPFIILLWLALSQGLAKERLVSAWFLLLVGGGRFLSEFWREPEIILPAFIPSLTYGQLLSIPMLIYGGWLWWQSKATH